MLKALLGPLFFGSLATLVVRATTDFSSADWEWWVLCSPFWVLGGLSCTALAKPAKT